MTDKLKLFFDNNDRFIFTVIGFILGVLFMILDISVIHADEINYYDWQLDEVSSLPEASSNTLNKVFKYNNKYYITESESSGGLSVGMQLCNVNFINNGTVFPDVTTDDNGIILAEATRLADNLVYSIRYVNSSWNNKVVSFFTTSAYFNGTWYSPISFSCNSYVLNRGGVVLTNIYSDTSVSSILDWFELESAGVVTYTWKEVSEDLVIPFDNHLDDRDFYLFYSFEDISEFNILSNYDFSNFSDYEKLVIVIGFNLLFLSFVGVVIYIFIKLLNKGFSLIFN